MATSIALEASPVARCTYCDIVEDGRPRARVVHSDAPAKGLRAIGLDRGSPVAQTQEIQSGNPRVANRQQTVDFPA